MKGVRMPVVWIPAALRSLTHQQESVRLVGTTLRAVIDELDGRFPGIKDRLCEGDRLRTGLAVVIDTEVIRAGLDQAVEENSEVHFLQAIGGG
jgi:molybdopterin synthase sulfur carrier subunit